MPVVATDSSIAVIEQLLYVIPPGVNFQDVEKYYKQGRDSAHRIQNP